MLWNGASSFCLPPPPFTLAGSCPGTFVAQIVTTVYPVEGLLQIGRGRIFLRGEYSLCSVSVWKSQKRLWYLGLILIIAQPSLFEFMISDVNCGLKDSSFC